MIVILGLQLCAIVETDTLYSLLLLKDDMSQASLRSLFGRCGSILSIQPMGSIHCVLHKSGPGLEVREG